MDKSLPVHLPAQRPRQPRPIWRLVGLALLVVGAVQWTYLSHSQLHPTTTHVPLHAAEIIDKCRALSVKPGPPADFNLRPQSDRFVAGTKPTLIKNATIWTGRLDGLEILKGDLLLDKGLIKEIGVIKGLESYAEYDLVDAKGSWVTPGIVDLHSHLSVDSSPKLSGSNDGNSHKGPILPWLRALDALNTHDDAYRLSISGGVTTSLVLPGSANAIGGQGIVIKLRRTTDRSPTSMLLENPYATNLSEYDPKTAYRFRQMKHACGENPDRVYSGTRMDTTWAFRQAYDKARQVKNAQDDYCANALAGNWDGLAPQFPEDYQWEALVDVLRGRVKVHTHCYETVDLDDLVRITNEFQFPIAAFHHAHETYLVPNTLKSAYGHPPAIALFSTHMRYKREAYRGSEFAPRILADSGLQVVLKSDHPVTDSRFLLYQAQEAHYFGLDANLALLSVTGTPAQVLGQDHRIGFIKSGYDADIVLWDSHPLAVGATPQQVWIDGVLQIASPSVIHKSDALQYSPKTPNFDKEAEDAVKYDGLPPLQPAKSIRHTVIFTNVSEVILRQGQEIQEAFTSRGGGVVVVDDGRISCSGPIAVCKNAFPEDAEVINLNGGSITPGLVSFGSALGLQEIQGEISTSDGITFDPLLQDVPEIVGGDRAIIRAADGLQYATRDALLAYRSGITTAVVAPKSNGFLSGLSTVFSTGAGHQLEKGAFIQDVAAVHVSIHHRAVPSVSTQIAALRRLLLGGAKGDLGHWFDRIVKGKTPLVIDVQNADIMASLLLLKAEVEKHHKSCSKFVFSGANEAHLLAKEIAKADVGVILTTPRPFPGTWESRRILPGPPLSADTQVSALLKHGVTVALGTKDASLARGTRLDIGWALVEAGGSISKKHAIALATTNLEKLLGIHNTDDADLVATRGGSLFDYSSKVVAVISPRREVVDVI